MAADPQYNSAGGPMFVNSGFHGPVHFDSVQSTPHPSTIPRSVTRLFTGREEIRNRLEQIFTTPFPSSLQIPRRFVISGLGGTGKSEICLKYATDRDQEYWGRFWIDCRNESTALTSFKRIGHLLSIQDPDTEQVKDYLSSTDKRWLLVVDNADDITFNYSSYFPAGGRGDIIITTRNPLLNKKYATVGFEKLPQLEQSLAQRLLLRSAGVPEPEWESKFDVAKKIVEELGLHTLAIIHAGAFIEQNPPIENYLEIFHEQKHILFTNRQEQEHADYATVHLTFEISMDRLRVLSSKGDAAAGDALELVKMLAFFSNQGQIEHIMELANKHLTHNKRRINEIGEIEANGSNLLKLYFCNDINLPAYLPDGSNSAKSKMRWRAACRKLESFSIITQSEFDEISPVLFIHPLVHQWLYHRYFIVESSATQNSLAAQSQAWLNTATILALSSYESRRPMYLIKNHLRACLSHSTRLYVQDLDDPSRIVPVLYRLLILRPLATLDKSELFEIIKNEIQRSENSALLVKEEALLQLRLDEEKQLRLDPGSPISIDRLRQLTHECETKLGESQVTRQARLFLAREYNNRGQMADAWELCNRVVRFDESIKNRDDNRLESVKLLAEICLASDRTDEATMLLETLLTIYKNWYPPEHIDRISLERTLSVAYLAAGRPSDATEILESTIQVGKDNPLRFDTWKNLAAAFQSNGQTQEEKTTRRGT